MNSGCDNCQSVILRLCGVVLEEQPHRGHGGFSGELGLISVRDDQSKTQTTGYASSGELVRQLSAVGKDAGLTSRPFTVLGMKRWRRG